MRRGLIVLSSIILIALLIFLVIQGFDEANIKILSYKQLDGESIKLKSYVEEYELLNNEKISQKQIEIENEIKTYQSTKQDYETKLAEREANLAKMGAGNISEIDFLLVKIGNYATEHKLNLLFDITKNISDPNVNEYILTDLNFKVEGIYYEIAQFIDKLEKDERLFFEIRDFQMVNGGESNLVKEGIEDGEVNPTVINPKTGEGIYNIVTATFKIYGIPIRKNTLSELTTSPTTDNTTNTTNSANNTNNTNNTNSTNSTNTTNSTSNTTNTSN